MPKETKLQKVTASKSLDQLAGLALDALASVASDPEAPAAARVAAANGILARVSPGAEPDRKKPVSAMSLAEIEAELGG